MEPYMIIAENLADVNNIEENKVEENFKGFYAKIKCSSIISPNSDSLQVSLSSIQSRDKVRISIKSLEDQTNIVTYSTGSDADEFIENIDISFDEDDQYLISIDIVKSNENNLISIYDIDSFSRYLEGLSLETILGEFSYRLKEDKNLLFDLVYGNNRSSSSSSIYFINSINNHNFSNIDRKSIMQNRSEVCNFINASNYKLTYDDFVFQAEINSTLNNILKKIECILSLIYISDRSEIIEKNKIRYSISGYKTLNFEVDYKNFDFRENMNEFTMICDWIYKDDSKNIVDKIAIVRNIISISLKENNIFDFDAGLLASIKSSHQIYMKENVEKYLQVKQEVSRTLFDLMKDVSQITDTVGIKLRNNIIGIITFFVSIIITNSLSDNRLEDIFTKDITMISIIFIVISIIYMKVSILDARSGINRFKVLYNRNKFNYNGILDDSDIHNIFHDDKYLKDDIKYIDENINRSVKLWVMVLLLISLIVFLLGDFKLEYISEPFINLINYIRK